MLGMGSFEAQVPTAGIFKAFRMVAPLGGSEQSLCGERWRQKATDTFHINNSGFCRKRDAVTIVKCSLL